MHIQKYISILEEHREDLANNKGDLYSLRTFIDLLDALDFAIDSLKAVDESLNETDGDTNN